MNLAQLGRLGGGCALSFLTMCLLTLWFQTVWMCMLGRYAIQGVGYACIEWLLPPPPSFF